MNNYVYKENSGRYLPWKLLFWITEILGGIATVSIIAMAGMEKNWNLGILFLSMILIISIIFLYLIEKEWMFAHRFSIFNNYFILPYSTWNDINNKKSPKVRYEDIKDIMFLSYGDIREYFPGDPMETTYPIDSPLFLGIKIILKDGRKYNIWKKRVGLEGLSALVGILKRKRKDIVLLEHLKIPSFFEEGQS